MPFIIPANTLATGGYDVENSLRFERASNDALNITPSNASNRKTFTVSAWIKKVDLTSPTTTTIISARVDGSNNFDLSFEDDFELRCKIEISDNNYFLRSTALYRDLSAWYHVVLAVDTTQSTDTNRVKLYVNGVILSSFATSTFPNQNADTSFNNTNVHQIGGTGGGGQTSMYLSEMVVIDGQALDPTSFGEFDSSGIWKPIDVSGLTFGTNGFYLEFKQAGTGTNASGMGADTSGNTNHLAVANLTAVDQSTDTCTNNFATMNPLNVGTSNRATFVEGNLKVTCGTTGGAYMGSSTIGVSSGKWYVEAGIKVIDSMLIGVSANATEDARDNSYPGQQGASAAILPDSGNKYVSDSGTTHGDAFTANDILMIALDLDNNNVYFGRNGNWFDGSGNADENNPNSAISLTAAASTQDGFYFFSVGDGGGSAAAVAEWNFGSPFTAITSSNADGNGFGNFEYAVPSGYLALCTKNLAENG